MKGLIKFLALATGLTVSYAAAVPSPAPAFSDIKDVIVKHYPDGLPDGLYPGPGLTSRATNLVKRGPVGVYICHDLNFSGDCVYVTSDINQCVDLAPQDNDVVSSFGPDRPWTCRVYVAFGCGEQEGAFTVSYPGISDLSLTDFNDNISSYRCS